MTKCSNCEIREAGGMFNVTEVVNGKIKQKKGPLCVVCYMLMPNAKMAGVPVSETFKQVVINADKLGRRSNGQ